MSQKFETLSARLPSLTIRHAAWGLTAAAFISATLIPFVAYGGKVRYSPSVALDLATAIAAAWAMVFAAENIRAFTAAEARKSEPLITVAVTRVGPGAGWKYSVVNMGQGGAVLSRIQCWVLDRDGRWVFFREPLPDPSLGPFKLLQFDAKKLVDANEGLAKLEVEFVRVGFETPSVLWFDVERLGLPISFTIGKGSAVSFEPRRAAVEALVHELSSDDWRETLGYSITILPETMSAFFQKQGLAGDHIGLPRLGSIEEIRRMVVMTAHALSGDEEARALLGWG